MDSSNGAAARFAQMRKLFTPDQLAKILQDDSIFQTVFEESPTTEPSATPHAVSVPTNGPANAVSKSISARKTDIKNAKEKVNGNGRDFRGDDDRNDDMSSGHHSSGTESWAEKPPATPKPQKKSSKIRTPEKPQRKTQKNKIEKAPSPSKLMSGLVLSSPLLGSAAKRKPMKSPEKKLSAQKPQTPKKKTAALQKPTKRIHKVALPNSAEESGGLKRFVVAIDFGTTFTSVSYYAHPINEDHFRAFPSEVKVIMNWPRDGMGGARRQVPTESWYPSVPRKRRAIDNQLEPDEFDAVVEWGESSDDEDHLTSEARQPIINNDNDIDMDDEHSSTYLWGYDVPYQRFKVHTNRDEFRRIIRPKLMLVRTSQSEYTEDDRIQLRPRLKSLIEQGLIRKFAHKDRENPRDVQDVISDFLIEILSHTKQQLIDIEHYTPDCKVSLVLTVPVIWDAGSSRVMEFAFAAAVQESNFGPLSYGCVDDLFLLTEPEAAATYLLGHSHDMLVSFQCLYQSRFMLNPATPGRRDLYCAGLWWRDSGLHYLHNRS
jgi:hypothetical protein